MKLFGAKRWKLFFHIMLHCYEKLQLLKGWMEGGTPYKMSGWSSWKTQTENNETRRAERGNNGGPARQVKTPGRRFLILSFSLSLSPLLPLFPALRLHQDAIIQDISEEELKALSVEEGPRVLSESSDANTHSCTHTHVDYKSRAGYRWRGKRW